MARLVALRRLSSRCFLSRFDSLLLCRNPERSWGLTCTSMGLCQSASVLFKHRLALSSGAADHSPMPHHCNPTTAPPLTHQPHHSPTTNPPEARDTIEVELHRDQGVPRRCHRGVRHAALLAYFHWTSQRSRRTMGRYIGGFNKSEDSESLEHRSRRSTPSIVVKIAIDRKERHIEMD